MGLSENVAQVQCWNQYVKSCEAVLQFRLKKKGVDALHSCTHSGTMGATDCIHSVTEFAKDFTLDFCLRTRVYRIMLA